MTPQERELFDKYAVLKLRVEILNGFVIGGPLGREPQLMDMIAEVQKAAQEFASLPRPEQKAA